jgi:hypothetical protein
MVIAGNQLQFTVNATDVDPENVLLDSGGLPPGATMAPPLPETGNPVASLFSWTPTIGDVGPHTVVFTATDPASASATRTIFINVDSGTPVILSLFAAEPTVQGVELHWAYADASDLAEEILERAPEHAEDWMPLPGEPRETEGTRFLLDGSVKPGLTYRYRLVAQDRAGERQVFGPITATALDLPARLVFSPVAPNPFSASTLISFALPAEGRVRLSVFDVQGREVATLLDEFRPAGWHQAVWAGDAEGNRAPAGLYFIRLATPAGAEVQRVVFTP